MATKTRWMATKVGGHFNVLAAIQRVLAAIQRVLAAIFLFW